MVTDFQHENAIVHRPVLDLCALEFFRQAEALSFIANFATLHDPCFLVIVDTKMHKVDDF